MIYLWFRPFISSLNQVQFLLPGDIWQCLETFVVFITGVEDVVPWHLVGRDQGAAKHPVIQYTGSTNNSLPKRSVCGGKKEKKRKILVYLNSTLNKREI